MRLKWHGKASFELESQGCAIQINPAAYRGNPEKADLIFITHNNEDHFNIEGLKKVAKPYTIAHGPKEIAAKIADGLQFKPLKEGNELVYGEVKIQATHAFHPEVEKHPEGQGLGFVFELEGKRVYHAGTSGFIPQMFMLDEIEVALLPIAGVYTMHMFEALEAIKIISPHTVVPMHYGGPDDLKVDTNKFKELVERQTHSRVKILDHDELFI